MSKERTATAAGAIRDRVDWMQIEYFSWSASSTEVLPMLHQIRINAMLQDLASI